MPNEIGSKFHVYYYEPGLPCKCTSICTPKLQRHFIPLPFVTLKIGIAFAKGLVAARKVARAIFVISGVILVDLTEIFNVVIVVVWVCFVAQGQ